MNGTYGTGETGAHEDEGRLEPHDAARLLAQTERRAQRGFDFKSPRLSLMAAGIVLIGFGAIWLSVRSQHPYKGPTPAGLIVLYILVAIRIVTVIYARGRAKAGISGRSVRTGRAEGAAVGVALVAVYVFMGALIDMGASDAVVYGVYAITAPLIVMGAVWAARSALREEWPTLGSALGVMLVAAGSAFAGPRGVWLSDAIGCCVVLLATGAAQAWLQRVPAPRA
ncbi:MAG: hypothetical protein ACRDL5_11385 [Solirubrobacteraceae bacterium]